MIQRNTPLAKVSRKKLEGLGFTPSSTLQRGKAPARKPMARRARYTGPTQVERGTLAFRSGGICEHPWLCGRPALQAHHRRPRGLGGSSAPDINDVSNLVHLCLEHHAWTESNRWLATIFGLLVPFSGHPARVRALLRHSKLPVLLLPDGGFLTFERACA